MEQSFGIRKTGITAVMIVVAALWTGLALAAAGAAQGQGPCADDVAKFCKDVQPGGGHIMRCIKEHENDLSPDCKERVTGMDQWLQGVREACQDDALTFCKDINPGSGRIVNCLKEHKNELSPECKAGMERGRNK